MPIIPNFIERLILLRLNQGPGLMLDFLGAQAFRAVCVAVKLGVFETLSDRPLTAAETARQIKADILGTAMLLEALEALGYVRKRNGRYVDTPMTVKWLLRSSPSSLADGIPFFENLVERWGYLDESIRQGKPRTTLREWLDQHPDRWRDAQAGWRALASTNADEVVAKVKLPHTARRLLDVGGGHGLYSVKFCHKYPKLSASVLDLPQALEAARETIAAEKIGGRVSVKAGDFWGDDLGSGYDVALLFNIIHGCSPDKNTELLHKVADALNPGALVIILDQIAGRVSGPAAKALARLTGLLLFNEAGGQTYAFDEIAKWLTKAGFTNPCRITLRKTPGFGLVLGTKTGQDKR